MSKTLQDIARKILDKAVETHKAYPAHQFANAAQCPFDKLSHGKIPKEAGERAYTSILSQDFEEGLITQDQATLMAAVNRTSVMGGLMALFPEWALQETLQLALENFTLNTEDSVRLFDNNDLMPAIMPSGFGNKAHENSSPIHINREFHAAEYGDKSSRYNENLNNGELIDSYKFMRDFPEYGLAVKWITGSVTDLARAIDNELETNPDYAALKESRIRETSRVISHDGAMALMDGRLPVTINAEIFKLGVNDEGHSSPEKITAAIKNSLTPNIFKRPRTNEQGEEFVGICPATRFNTRCIGTTIGNAPALSQFIDKIQAVAKGLDTNTNDVDVIHVLNAQKDYSQLMDTMLTTPDAIKAQDEINTHSGVIPTISKGVSKTHP